MESTLSEEKNTKVILSADKAFAVMLLSISVCHVVFSLLSKSIFDMDKSNKGGII